MDFSKLNVATLDRSKLDEGVFVEYSKGIFFKLRRAGNLQYSTALAESWNETDVDTLTNDEAAAILDELMIKHCITGWDGLKEDGVDVPFSTEIAIELLTCVEGSDIKDWIYEQINTVENFRSGKLKK